MVANSPVRGHERVPQVGLAVVVVRQNDVPVRLDDEVRSHYAKSLMLRRDCRPRPAQAAVGGPVHVRMATVVDLVPSHIAVAVVGADQEVVARDPRIVEHLRRTSAFDHHGITEHLSLVGGQTDEGSAFAGEARRLIEVKRAEPAHEPRVVPCVISDHSIYHALPTTRGVAWIVVPGRNPPAHVAPASVDIDQPRFDAPQLQSRPDWKALTIVEPYADVSG